MRVGWQRTHRNSHYGVIARRTLPKQSPPGRAGDCFVGKERLLAMTK